jgi:hypothetical protein
MSTRSRVLALLPKSSRKPATIRQPAGGGETSRRGRRAAASTVDRREASPHGAAANSVAPVRPASTRCRSSTAKPSRAGKKFPAAKLVAFVIAAAACDSTPATVCDFDLHADLTNQDLFYSMPYPSDLRLLPSGAPDLRGFPNNLQESLIESVRAVAMQRKGFPQMGAAYFHFDGPLAPEDPTVVMAAAATSPILLVDVDPSSPERGKLFPVVAGTPDADRYLLDDTLEIAPRTGVVLHESRTYAYVVMKSLGDAAGNPLGAPDAFVALEAATPPPADPELAAWNLYQPLWQTLAQIGVDETEVAAATVYTTGDVVQDAADLATKTIANYAPTITNLSVRSDQGTFCEVVGQITYPQFQKGTPPYDDGLGTFDIGQDGLPIKQRDEVVPVAISLPEGQPMPAGGFPFILYFHGSGGLSTQLFDPEAYPDPGHGAAYVMAARGFAMACQALPLAPERLPGATDNEEINFNNLGCFPYTFEQGVMEQRMFIGALDKLTIDPATVASCTGLSLPNGETAYHFAMDPLHVQGQSMGGMYANLVGATEPRVKIVVPTGAGGDWPYMMLTTNAIPNAKNGIKLLLGSGDLTFMHPALQLLGTAWEPAETFVYMRRLGKDPLPGHPARPVYEPVGYGDEYFSFDVYDGAALAYGNKEAGDAVWPSMQSSLSVEGLDGIVPYPVSNDVTSSDGSSYTGVVAQYNGDGVSDPHYIFTTVDAVKYQYACFHTSFRDTGTATVFAPKAWDAPCGP